MVEALNTITQNPLFKNDLKNHINRMTEIMMKATNKKHYEILSEYGNGFIVDFINELMNEFEDEFLKSIELKRSNHDTTLFSKKRHLEPEGVFSWSLYEGM